MTVIMLLFAITVSCRFLSVLVLVIGIVTALDLLPPSFLTLPAHPRSPIIIALRTAVTIRG